MKRKLAKLAKATAPAALTANRVWMVYGDCGRTPPKYLHYSEKSAREEAIRLAESNVGSHFFVLRAIACFHAPKPQAAPVKLVAPTHQAIDDDIPF